MALNWRENLARSKEALGAIWRQGLHELGAALYGPGTAAQPPEYGMPHTKTPGEVDRGRRFEERSPEQDPRSILDERLNRADQTRDDREPPAPEIERD